MRHVKSNNSVRPPMKIQIPLQPVKGAAQSILPANINSIVQNEYAVKYLEDIGVHPTKENVDFVLTNLPIKEAAVIPSWANETLTIVPGGADQAKQNLLPLSIGQELKRKKEHGIRFLGDGVSIPDKKKKNTNLNDRIPKPGHDLDFLSFPTFQAKAIKDRKVSRQHVDISACMNYILFFLADVELERYSSILNPLNINDNHIEKYLNIFVGAMIETRIVKGYTVYCVITLTGMLHPSVRFLTDSLKAVRNLDENGRKNDTSQYFMSQQPDDNPFFDLDSDKGGYSLSSQTSLTMDEKETVLIQLQEGLVFISEQIRARTKRQSGLMKVAFLTCAHFVVNDVLISGYESLLPQKISPPTISRKGSTQHKPNKMESKPQALREKGIGKEINFDDEEEDEDEDEDDFNPWKREAGARNAELPSSQSQEDQVIQKRSLSNMMTLSLGLCLRRLVHHCLSDVLDPSRIYAETLCVPGLADDGLAFAPVAVAIGYLISGDRGRFRATSFATKSLFSSTSSSGAGDGDALTDPTINRILHYDSVSQRARGLPLPSGLLFPEVISGEGRVDRSRRQQRIAISEGKLDWNHSQRTGDVGAFRALRPHEHGGYISAAAGSHSDSASHTSDLYSLSTADSEPSHARGHGEYNDSNDRAIHGHHHRGRPSATLVDTKSSPFSSQQRAYPEGVQSAIADEVFNNSSNRRTEITVIDSVPRTDRNVVGGGTARSVSYLKSDAIKKVFSSSSSSLLSIDKSNTFGSGGVEVDHRTTKSVPTSPIKGNHNSDGNMGRLHTIQSSHSYGSDPVQGPRSYSPNTSLTFQLQRRSVGTLTGGLGREAGRGGGEVGLRKKSVKILVPPVTGPSTTCTASTSRSPVAGFSFMPQNDLQKPQRIFSTSRVGGAGEAPAISSVFVDESKPGVGVQVKGEKDPRGREDKFLDFANLFHTSRQSAVITPPADAANTEHGFPEGERSVSPTAGRRKSTVTNTPKLSVQRRLSTEARGSLMSIVVDKTRKNYLAPRDGVLEAATRYGLLESR